MIVTPLLRHCGSLTRLRGRSRATLRERLRRVRLGAWLALQAGLAAGLSWWTATELVGHERPFFAPIAAVVTLAVSVGQRLRRAVELIFGVAIGIAVSDLIIVWIGTGPAQISVVVALAIMVAIFLGSGAALVTQAANSAVLVATLTLPGTGTSGPRFVDALVGGFVALGVMALLLPTHPLRLVRRATSPLMQLLSTGLAETATALADRDRSRAENVLGRLRAGEEDLRRLQEALEAGRETATLAPVRWRSRGGLAQYLDNAEHVGYALRNVRVLVRRVIGVISEDESAPEELTEAAKLLGESVHWLGRELAQGVEPDACRGRALSAVQAASAAYETGVGFSGSVIVAQVRSTCLDLLRASGLTNAEADNLLRSATR